MTASAAPEFTAEERAAMKARAKELKANQNAAEALKEVLDRIAAMEESDRVLAERIHAIVTEAAPQLKPKTWYGMPAYALDGKVVCFFKDAGKFGERYATLGFDQKAALDDGGMWPVAFAITNLTPAAENKIAELVTKAVG